MNDDTISRAVVFDSVEIFLKQTDAPEVYPGLIPALARVINNVPSTQPEIIRCKDCKHKPYPSDNYDYGNGDCGFEIIFPDYRCPCRCDDEYYNRIPDDDWFCGNAERRTDE